MLADLIRHARSTRRFVETERIAPETLQEWIETIRFVPSAGNLQPLRYRLVYTQPDCDAIFPFTAWAGYLSDWDGPAAGERPAAYILILSAAEKAKPDTDAGIATQTLQLLAAEAGYGACMLGALHREDIHRVLDIPGEYQILLALALGKPAEQIVAENAGPATDGLEAIKYWRDAQGVHHVPKRARKDLLV